MQTLEDIIGQASIEEYDADARKIMALIKSGHPVKFTKPEPKSAKTIRTEMKQVKSPESPKQLPVPVAEAEVETPTIDHLPALVYKEEKPVVNMEVEAKELLSFMGEAQLYAQFCESVLERLEADESRIETWKIIAAEYNNGNLVPELYKLRGKRTERSLRKWVDLYLDSERDMFALIHKAKRGMRGRKVTFLEQNILKKMLLTPQKVKIYTAVSTLKAYARMGSLESPSSIPTLVRWCQDYERNNKAIWTQARLGSKAVAEDIVKTIHRDNSLLSVGDVWVADGHILAFDIVNPKTGKAQRMTMIMVMDWASRYPVGASLAYTEDSQHIQMAFRNGFLNWGAVPKYVYLDNGKAFRSKLFNEKWQEHDLSSDLAGIFPRLGIKVAFAESYNAKAKIIERFFKTFQEQFERFISSFRGACIADKPATLMRNEKWARKMFEGNPPTLEEAMQMIGFYVRYMYGENPHSGLNGQQPFAVFKNASVPEECKVESRRLNFLMMSAVRKTLRNNGITLNKLMYWDTELMEHIGKEVVIRYDLADLRWIAVYDMQDNFLCQAEVRRAQDPFVHLNMEDPTSHAELNKEYKAIKRHQRMIATRTKLVIKNSQEVVHKLMKPLPALQSNPTFIQDPILSKPDHASEELMQQLEQQVIKQIPLQPELPQPDVAPVFENGEIKPKEKSLKEMLEFIGIN
jgi:putative transposase